MLVSREQRSLMALYRLCATSVMPKPCVDPQIVEVINPRDRDQRLEQLLRKYHSSRRNRVIVFVLYKKEVAAAPTRTCPVFGCLRTCRDANFQNFHGYRAASSRCKSSEVDKFC